MLKFRFEMGKSILVVSAVFLTCSHIQPSLGLPVSQELDTSVDEPTQDNEPAEMNHLQDSSKNSSRQSRQYGGFYPGQYTQNFGLNVADANAFASPAGSNANAFSATGDIYNGFTLSNANSFHTPGLNSFIGG